MEQTVFGEILSVVRFEGTAGAPTSPRRVPCSDPELPSFSNLF
jgi:hypothetical protein